MKSHFGTLRSSSSQTFELLLYLLMARRRPSGDGAAHHSRSTPCSDSIVLTLLSKPISNRACAPVLLLTAAHKLLLSADQSKLYISAQPGTPISRVRPSANESTRTPNSSRAARFLAQARYCPLGERHQSKLSASISASFSSAPLPFTGSKVKKVCLPASILL